MASVRRTMGVLLWGFAGIPILGTALQAVFAYSPRRAGERALLGPISDALRQLEILDRAALAFEADPAIISGAFVLAAVGWFIVGVSMWRNSRRSSIVAAGVVTTFVLPFVGAYAPLLSAPVSEAHVAGFFAIAGAAIVATWASPLLFWGGGGPETDSYAEQGSGGSDTHSSLETAEQNLGVLPDPARSSGTTGRIEATIERTDRRLERTESELQRVPGALGRRLRALLVDPPAESEADVGSDRLPTVIDVRNRLDDAGATLADGEHDAAHRIATGAATDAADLLETAEFFVDLARTLAAREDRIQLPDSVPESLAEGVITDVERTYGIDCRLESGVFVFSFDERGGTESSARISTRRRVERRTGTLLE
ncbi:MAG: hypothetical protein ACOCQ3_00305 [Natronomonas sp.]